VGREHAGRQHGDSILAALALADGDLASFEVEVLHAQLQAFKQAESGAVEEGSGKPRHSRELTQHCSHFGAGEDDGQGWRRAHARDLGQVGQGPGEDDAVEEDDGAQRLVLGGGADVVVRGEGREEARDGVFAERGGVAFFVKEDEALRPEAVSLLGAGAEVADAAGVAELVEEPGL